MEDDIILIVDDSVININILESILDKYDVIVATDGETALSILEDEEVNLILLDIVMPDMDGYEVCKRVKNSEHTKNIPIIFTTSKTDEDSIEVAYDCGASDYVVKPFKPKELLARVRTQLKIQKMEKELRLLALIDSMTKLYNRRYLSRISEHMISLALRHKQDLSIIMIDIDNFKEINDNYGHQIGDDVIIELSNMLMIKQRKSDVICRYGGEEFLILLPNTSLNDTEKIAENIRKNVENISIKLTSDKALKFTVSLGVSTVCIHNDKNIESSIKRADDALYYAKKNGKNMSYSI